MNIRLGRVLGGLGWFSAGLLLLLALLVTLTRQFLPAVSEYREELVGLLSEQLGVPLDMDAIQGQWDGASPQLSIRGLRVFADTDAGPEVRAYVDSISIELDLLSSLTHLVPVFRQAQLSGLQLTWRERDGRWLHRPGAGEGGSGLKADAWNRMLALAMIQPAVSISDVELTLLPESGTPRVLRAPRLLLNNSASEHQLSGDLVLPAAGDKGGVRFAIETRGAAEDLLQARYDFYLSLDELGPDLLNLELLPVQVERLRASTEFWGRVSAGRLDSLQGSVDVAEFSAASPGVPDISDARTDFALLRSGERYQLQLNRLALSSAGAVLAVPQLLLEALWQDGQLKPAQIAGSGLELAPLGLWVQSQPFVPEGLKAALLPLAPAGLLTRFRADWPQNDDWSGFELQADLARLSSEAAWGAPRVSGVSGRLEANLRGGRLHLDSTDFELFFPDLYDRGWAYDQADGIVRWSLEPDAVVIGSELLHLNNASVSAAGRFSMRLPYQHEEQTELTLMIGMTDSDALQTANYVPPDEVGRSLYDWLAGAIQGGRLRQGGFLLHGGTRRLGDGVAPTVQMFFDVDQADMAYQPGWPAVEAARAFVMLRDRALLVEVEEGRLMASNVEHARVYLPGPDAPLQIDGQLSGDAADIHRLLMESPLRPLVGDELAQWELRGPAQTALRLQIPLAATPLPRVGVATRLASGTLASESLRLAFSDLHGDLHYSTSKGLRAERLDGRMQGEPVRAQISTPGTTPWRTRVSLAGELPMAQLADWSELDILQGLSGKAAYNARLDLCNGAQDCNRLVITSDLAGVAVPWPGFLGKPAAEPRSLSVVVGLNEGTLRLNYDERLRGVFDLVPPLAGRGRITFGGARPDLPPAGGLWVDGRIEAISTDELEAFAQQQGWQASLAGASAPAATATGDLALRALDVQVGQLDVRGMLFAQASVHLATEPWQLFVQTAELDATLGWPAQPGLPYRLQVKTLNLPEPEAASPSSEDSAATPEPIDLSGMPAVDVSISSLSLGARNLGQWQFALRPQPGRLAFEAVEGHIGGLDVRGEGSWRESPAISTELTLKLQGGDIGTLMEAWGGGRVLTSDSTDAYLQLGWMRRPWDISLAQAQGELAFRLEDGRIIESGGASNILRIFGILNLNSLARRFKLDFSDLLRSGLAYDSLSGRYRFERGQARTLEPLRLQGPSADMTMTGRLDLLAETVEQDMEVTLPLTSNIPLAAVLLGAPQVAGAVFLIDKLIGDKLEKVTTIRYRVSGDWNDPEVSVMRSQSSE
ncbi:YhdP family protein [Marinobacterium rhizophilum]|uniref:TIGR02099 family protein n=1 Tax=Marinobacterium rhizophilum TaxID=420402 RepID=A0ABY5HNK0_9GAMM|nr:YhdP family protein [Marinobacterium rhizophilum]UTW14011.1 TIGR02099 family protein [Marinobacterium rhizophilum]